MAKRATLGWPGRLCSVIAETASRAMTHNHDSEIRLFSLTVCVPQKKETKACRGWTDIGIPSYKPPPPNRLFFKEGFTRPADSAAC